MIPFTQFLRPHGEKRAIDISRPPRIEQLADALLDEGCHFDIEELTTGTISITCENDSLDEEDVVLAHELCANGPPVLDAVDKLLTVATDRLAEIKRNQA